MQVALLADIHGNMDALEAVLNDADSKGIRTLAVCGDLVGYYYRIGDVLSALKERDAVMCRGNHEDMLQNYIDGDEETRSAIQKKYGSSYASACEELSDEEMNILLGLEHPVSIDFDGVRFLLSHGCPWGIDTYLYPDASEEDLKNLQNYQNDCDVIVTAHTHYQAAWQYEGLTVINPGSVGQPRSGKTREDNFIARAHWASYDTERKTFEHHETTYDCTNLFKEIESRDPDLPFLKNVLKRQEYLT